jgi:hypothetical protein
VRLRGISHLAKSERQIASATHTGFLGEPGNVPLANIRRSLNRSLMGSFDKRLADQIYYEFLCCKDVVSRVLGLPRGKSERDADDWGVVGYLSVEVVRAKSGRYLFIIYHLKKTGDVHQLL